MSTQKFSLIGRILHWTTAFSLLFILLTIFLRLTWMNKNNVAAIVMDNLNATDITIEKDQAIIMAKQIRSPMWVWHIYIGYVLIGLFSLRMALTSFKILSFKNPFNKKYSNRERFQSWVYSVFYLLVFITLSTGLLLVFGPDGVRKTIKFVHELSWYYLIGFIILHFCGIIIAENGSKKGIVSEMINGGNKKD